MAKPKTNFSNIFESILIKAWGSYQSQLDENLLRKTREALSYIRRVYRFKGELGAESPSHIDYKEPKNRAGYLAAFGERHAYLSYAHLKKLQAVDQNAIPLPNKHGELTVTVVGAGPAIETYGLCHFYNESNHTIKRLTLNLIEKVREWQPTRDLVTTTLIKEMLPKVDIYTIPIEADIKEPSCIQTFASHHDSIISSDILIIYNTLNEIDSKFAPIVLRNLSYIIRQCDQPLLILLAEPSARNAYPRIRWIRELLLQYSKVYIDELESEISFLEEPTKIELSGVNELLFSRKIEKNPPTFENSLNRLVMACQMVPPELFASQRYDQLKRLLLKRDRKGKILKIAGDTSLERQLTMLS